MNDPRTSHRELLSESLTHQSPTDQNGSEGNQSRLRRITILTDIICIIGLFLAGLYFVYLPYSGQMTFPMGWDTRRYVLALISIKYYGWSGVITSSPFRFGYYIPETLMSSMLNLNPYQSEILYPVILASAIPPLFYVAAKQITHKLFAGLVGGILGVAWRGQTRLVRDLHSNLLFFDLVLIIGIAFSFYFAKSYSKKQSLILTGIIAILLTYALTVYPLSFFLLLIPLGILARSWWINRETVRISVPKLLRMNYQMVLIFLIPLLAFGLLSFIVSILARNSSSPSVITADAGSLFAPPSPASLELLNPSSTTFLLTDGWTGNGGPSLPNFEAIISLTLSLFAIAGIGFTLWKGMKSRNSSLQDMIFSYYSFFVVIFIALLLFASFVGISVPPDRALNDFPLPLFSALGVSVVLSFFEKRRILLDRLNTSLMFLIVLFAVAVILIQFHVLSSDGNPLISTIDILTMIGLGIAWLYYTIRSDKRSHEIYSLSKIIALSLIVLFLGSSLLPLNQSYSAGGNQTLYFSQADYNQVNVVKAWLALHSAPKPYIIVDNVTDSADYVQLHVEVAQTYFGSVPTLVYYGDLSNLIANNYTTTNNSSNTQLSQYYYQILSQTPSYENGTVILLSFLYPVFNQSNLVLTTVGDGCYVFNLATARTQSA